MSADNRTKIHLAMLSPNTGESKLRFYLNRPMSAFEADPDAFCYISHFMADLQVDTFKAIAMEAVWREGLAGCTIPDEDGMVLEFELMPGVNPTEVLCTLGEALAKVFRIHSLWEVFIAGRYGQETPPSRNELIVMDQPADYLDKQASHEMYGALT